MNININKFDKICRTCLTEKVDMRPIFEAFVADMLTACASVQIVESDGLPKSICIQCLQQVNRSYSFKQLCEKSDSSLRHYLQGLQNSCTVKEDKREDAVTPTRKCLTRNGITEDKESVEYRIKTEQLKLEISEHLKLNLEQSVNCLVSCKVDASENSCQSYCEGITNAISEEQEDNSSVDNEGREEDFRCSDCQETFKGIS